MRKNELLEEITRGGGVIAPGLDMAISAKEKHRTKLLEYLGDPGNEWMTRSTLATEVLGYTNTQGIWRLFTGEELDAIEAEALEIRRQRCASTSAKIDQALVKRAIDGDVAAMKLYYQRYENWSERQTRELTGKDGGPIKARSVKELTYEELMAIASRGRAGTTEAEEG